MDILIAEDDRSTRLLLEALLRAEGYSVVAVGDGRLALDALSASSFDAVVTDWMMPQMDGIELVQWIRAAVKPAPVVLMVTAADTDAARNRALEAGADDYLVKPVRAAALRRQLAEAIARRQQAAPPAPGPPQILLERRAPPFRCVAFVASSGGPVALLELLRGVRQRGGVAGVVVLRGPQWMLESLAARLRLETSWPARVLTDGDQVLPGELDRLAQPVAHDRRAAALARGRGPEARRRGGRQHPRVLRAAVRPELHCGDPDRPGSGRSRGRSVRGRCRRRGPGAGSSDRARAAAAARHPRRRHASAGAAPERDGTGPAARAMIRGCPVNCGQDAGSTRRGPGAAHRG
ncbi:MAG: response regulator [Planctomycetota bacterium]